jgi:putative transposase
LREFRPSSYWYLWRPELRPKFLELRTALKEAGGLADTPAGRQSYGDYLAWQAQAGPAGRNAAYVSLSRGWALGTREFKAALIQDHALAANARAWENSGAQEIREQAWTEILAAGLRKAGKTSEAAAAARKSAPWKVAIAAELKRRTQATNRWIAEQLHMGSAVAVSQYVGRARRATVVPAPEAAIE